MTEEDPDGFDWSSVYRALADDRRRSVLRFVAYGDGRCRIGDAANHLLREADELGAEELDRTLQRLHHVDLPLLADASLVRWDREADEIALTDRGFRLPFGIVSPGPSADPDRQVPTRVGD